MILALVILVKPEGFKDALNTYLSVAIENLQRKNIIVKDIVKIYKIFKLKNNRPL